MFRAFQMQTMDGPCPGASNYAFFGQRTSDGQQFSNAFRMLGPNRFCVILVSRARREITT